VPTQSTLAPKLDPADGPAFVARDLEPELTNPEEVGHLLNRSYPSGYRDTGLDATTLPWSA
jgi:hypothetical protein